jgi:hypothetical protein
MVHEQVDKLFEFVGEVSSSGSVTKAGNVQSCASARHGGMIGASMKDLINGKREDRVFVVWERWRWNGERSRRANCRGEPCSGQP